jgi:YVTN family beta-propeller protein
MEFRILGPLEVARDGRVLPLGSGRQLALVAVLLIHANEAVSVDRLVDELWAGSPPPSAAKIVRNSVSVLRRELGDRLVTKPPGYLLRVEQGELDSEQLERALESKDIHQLTDALALWRGPPLSQVAYEPFAQHEIARLEELHLAAVEARIDAQLALGRHTDVIPELETLVRLHPLRERLCAQLMLAQYRSGRQADALEAYRQERQRLDEQLGIEPGPALRELERKILNQDESLAPPTSAQPATSSGRSRALKLVVAGALVLLAAAVAAAAFELTEGGEANLAGLAGNSVGIVDPESGRILAQVPVGASPSGVAAGAGSVWVASTDEGTTTRLDFGKAVLRQAIGVGSGPAGIAADERGTWVANSLRGTVSRIDPSANRVVQTIRVGSAPADIALGAGAVWVVSEGDQLLTGLDPRTGDETARIHFGASPRAVAVGAGSVWVADEERGAVFRIDPVRRTPVDTISVGSGPVDVAVGAGSVWVANNLDGTVSRVDPARDRVVATIPVGDGPRSLAIVDGSAWVSNEFGGTVVRIDPAMNAVDRVIHVGEQPEGLARVGKRLVVAVRPAGIAHRGGTLRLVSGHPAYEPGSIDTLNLSFAATTIMTNDGLVGFRRVGGADGGELVPDLALTLPVPTDRGRTYTFQIRTGIRYSDGRPLRAADFRRALERAIALHRDSPGFGAIVGAGACAAQPKDCDLSKGIVTDDRSGTVTFHLAEPDPDFLYKLALPQAFAVPERTPLKDVGVHPLPATGPYMVRSYRPKGALTFVRNPRFRQWSRAAQPAGYPDRIVIDTAKSPRHAVTAVEDGRRDLTVDGVPLPLVHEVETQYASQVHTNPIRAVTYLFLNTKVPPFNDLRVRRAVNYAADRLAGARISTRGTGAQPTCEILPPDFPGYQPYCPYTLHPSRGVWNGPDLTRARRLVRASGTSGAAVTIWEPKNHRGESPFIATLLRSLGYRARVKRVSNDTYYGPATGPFNSRLRVQAGPFSWFADYPAASNYIVTFFSCDVPNWSQFCNRRIEAQIRRALALQATDPYLANRLWARIDREIVDQAVVVPLFTLRQIDIVSIRVGNYRYHPQWGVLVDQLWVR